MTHSILNDCLLLRDKGTEKINDYLQTIGVHIFDDIIAKYKEEAVQIILYILCAYDEQSPLVISRQDSKAEMESICEYLNITEFKRLDITGLVDKCVKTAATQYIEQFAGQEFKTLMFQKIQLADMERDITNRDIVTTVTAKGKNGEPDVITVTPNIKAHFSAINGCRQLAHEIEKQEKIMKNKIKFMGIGNMNEWLNKNKYKSNSPGSGQYSGSSIEHSNLIK